LIDFQSVLIKDDKENSAKLAQDDRERKKFKEVSSHIKASNVSKA
jgi:hypothetical protein